MSSEERMPEVYVSLPVLNRLSQIAYEGTTHLDDC